MTGAAPEPAAGAAPDPQQQRRDRARQRRRVDEVFGDVLPATTSDERDPGHRRGFSLDHYESARPPHWGDKQ